jgi:hypothetical protein
MGGGYREKQGAWKYDTRLGKIVLPEGSDPLAEND